MKWTLLVTVLASLSLGIAHAAVAGSRAAKTCPRGQALRNGQCISQAIAPTPVPQQHQPQTPQSASQIQSQPAKQCPAGQTLRGDKCTPKNCPQRMALNAEGKCDCATGFRKVNSSCVSVVAAQACPGGHLSKKGNCVQPTPARTKTCPKDHQLDAQGKCRLVVMGAKSCPSGQRKNKKGNCIPIVAGESCGSNLWINERGECGPTRPNNGCPVGKERNGLGNCVKIQICTAGQVKDPKTGVCQIPCPSNQVMKDGKCTTIDINRAARG